MEFLTNYEMRSADPVREGRRIRRLLKDWKVVHIRAGWHIADLREFYDSLTNEVGRCVDIGEDFTQGGAATGEKWLEIRYDHDIPDLVAFRHSKNAQPLHTDESYVPDPADIMFFYCVNRARRGGATTFVDGHDLVMRLKQIDRQLLEELRHTVVTFKKADRERTQPVIGYDDAGRICINYNYFCADTNQAPSKLELVRRFHDFLTAHVIRSDIEREVLLQPAEAVAWSDAFVLHGRDSFDADKSNDRFIWKTGIRVAKPAAPIYAVSNFTVPRQQVAPASIQEKCTHYL